MVVGRNREITDQPLPYGYAENSSLLILLPSTQHQHLQGEGLS